MQTWAGMCVSQDNNENTIDCGTPDSYAQEIRKLWAAQQDGFSPLSFFVREPLFYHVRTFLASIAFAVHLLCIAIIYEIAL